MHQYNVPVCICSYNTGKVQDVTNLPLDDPVKLPPLGLPPEGTDPPPVCTENCKINVENIVGKGTNTRNQH